jgi:hypothetical protein
VVSLREGEGEGVVMRLRARLTKLEAATPKCDGRIRKVAFAGYVPTEADRCRLCGGCHVLVITKKVVRSRAETTPREASAMRLTSRVRKLEAARPRCDGRTRKLVDPDYVVTEADRCRLCGGCHVLVIEEVIVESHEEAYALQEREGEGEDTP